MSSSSARTVVLKSSDGETFRMEEAVARLSPVINRMIEEDGTKTSIVIPNVTGNILSKVIDYCRKHVNGAVDEAILKSYDREFVKVDEATLLELANAAMFLELSGLLCLSVETLACKLSVKVILGRKRLIYGGEGSEAPP